MTRAHYPFWPARVPHAIEPPATALPDNLLVSARRFPHRSALVYLGQATTYAALAEQVARLAAWLGERGIRKGDRVAVGLQNCPQLVIAHYAVLSANAVVVPVNPMNRAAELKHLIEDSGAVLAITSADLSAEWLAAGMAAANLLVTRLAEVLPGGRADGAGLPAGWADWLNADIALPAGATCWADALACTADACHHCLLSAPLADRSPSGLSYEVANACLPIATDKFSDPPFIPTTAGPTHCYF